MWGEGEREEGEKGRRKSRRERREGIQRRTNNDWLREQIH